MGALALVSVSTADLIVSALDLALDFGVTTYDGCYAALAQLPLVTVDMPLSRKLEGSEVKVRLLEEFFFIGEEGRGCP